MLGELGTPGPEIQALAGHANLSTTEVYLHLSPNATRSAIARIDHANGEIVEKESAKPKNAVNARNSPFLYCCTQ